MAKTKAEIDKNYEERHKEERKEKYLVWGKELRGTAQGREKGKVPCMGNERIA